MKSKTFLVVALCVLKVFWSGCESQEQKEIQSLIMQLGNADAFIRLNAVEALVLLGEPAVPALIKALGEEKQQVRSYARFTLVRIGEPAIPALMKASGDRNERIRKWAKGALSEILLSQ